MFVLPRVFLCYRSLLGLLANMAFHLQPNRLASAGLQNETYLPVSTGQLVGCYNYLPPHLWGKPGPLTLKELRSRESTLLIQVDPKERQKRMGLRHKPLVSSSQMTIRWVPPLPWGEGKSGEVREAGCVIPGSSLHVETRGVMMGSVCFQPLALSHHRVLSNHIIPLRYFIDCYFCSSISFIA